MCGTSAPPPMEKPKTLTIGEGAQFEFSGATDTAGMAKTKVKRRLAQTITISIPILPQQINPLQLPFTTPRMSTVVIQPSPFILPHMIGSPGQFVPPKPLEGEAQKIKLPRTSVPRMCSKCGEERLPPVHQQYMGYRYCGKTDPLPFSDWRADLQARGVARKGKNK